MIGKSEASVTIPKPERLFSPLPAAAAIPMPSESTRGTVTGACRHCTAVPCESNNLVELVVEERVDRETQRRDQAR